MTILFPQWQGSGKSNEIEYGANSLGEFFSDIIDERIKLVKDEFHVINDVIFQDAIVKQLQSYIDVLNKVKPKYLTTVGGDCGIEVIPVSYLNKLYDNLGIIWIDAHADINTPESSPSKTFHGMPVRLLLGEGNDSLKKLLFSTIQARQIHYVGLRDVDTLENNYIEQNGIFNTAQAIKEDIKLQLQASGYKKLYIHLDFDVINPNEYSYVKCPAKGGLSIAELESLFMDLQENFEVVGYGICETTAKDWNALKPLEKILNLIKNDSKLG